MSNERALKQRVHWVILSLEVSIDENALLQFLMEIDANGFIVPSEEVLILGLTKGDCCEFDVISKKSLGVQKKFMFNAC